MRLRILRALAERLGGRAAASPVWPRHVARALREVRKRRLTYLEPRKLESLAALALSLERAGEPGSFVEAGCALGGSSIVLCSAKSRARPLRVYDVFGRIPPPSDKDGEDVHARYEVIASGRAKGLGAGDPYYGYRTDLRRSVEESFSRLGYPIAGHSVELVPGLIAETLRLEEPVCLAHVDVDWYEPVLTCLERIVPLLTPRGAVVLDDYADWSGCRRATDEYFERVGRDHFEFDASPGHLVVRRRGS